MTSCLPISVSIIASNEEKNLARCLSSLRDIASEIILVHNDCTDNSVTVAESFGAKCIKENWHGHRDQKNIALNHATNPWVLCMDADEALSDQLRKSIIECVKSNEKSVSGAMFNRMSWFMGRWIRNGDWYPDSKIRLVRNGHAKWVGSREHDKLELSNGNCQKLKGDLLHYSYPRMTTFVEKTIYFSDIYLERQLAAGKTWKISNILFRPIWRFFRAYVLRLGFLDGFPGFFIAVATAYTTLVRHSRLYEHERT